MSRPTTPARGIAGECPLCEGIFELKEDGSCSCCGYRVGKKRRSRTPVTERREKRQKYNDHSAKTLTVPKDTCPDDIRNEILDQQRSTNTNKELLFEENDLLQGHMDQRVLDSIPYVDEALDIPYDFDTHFEDVSLSPLNIEYIDEIIDHFYP